MIACTIDLGLHTRTGLALMDTNTAELIDTRTMVADNSIEPSKFRKRIVEEIEFDWLQKHKIDCIVFESINLFRGQGVSPLKNILSLCKLQTTIVDSLSDYCEIYSVDVRSWKSRAFGSAKADKDDAIRLVRGRYPQVDLEIKTYRPRKKITEITYNHDLADAICIGFAIHRDKEVLKPKNSLRYQ